MMRTPSSATVTIAAAAAVLGGIALAAQDKYTLQVPNGLAFSDFRGYENWEDVAVSATETGIKVIVANPAMIAAYRDGLPAAGKQFPDGSKVAKIEWTVKRSGESPYFVLVPDTLKSVSFIEKDTKRFPDTHGWAYAQFGYDAASDAFTPHGMTPSAGTSAIPRCRQKITSSRRIRRDEAEEALPSSHPARAISCDLRLHALAND